MIIARIEGGLGNQMFQYAYGMFLARKHKTTLLLDVSSYEDKPQHGYLLDNFHIEAQIAGEKDAPKIPRRYRTKEARTPWWKDGFGLNSFRRYKEQEFGFLPAHLEVPNNRYLVGYWQSEKYFPDMRRELLQQFALRHQLSPTSQEVGKSMRNCNSVALHVRRGDYITSTSAAQIYEHLSIEYYQRSLQEWTKDIQDPRVFIFSNDIAWCREQFNLPWQTQFVDHTNVDTAFEDMWMMLQASCLIMANSTFSWWAGWLNQRPDHTVIAPSRWFRPGTLNSDHLLPTNWTVSPVDPLAKSDATVSRHAA